MDASVQASLLEQLPNVETTFLTAHAAVLLEELARVPGVDSVRAVAIRHIEVLQPDEALRGAALQGAAQALRAYPDAVKEGDPLQLMTRHPAWVGLCHLELAEALKGDSEAALEVAVSHAQLGFSATVGQEVAPGEAAWAIAEMAEESGWEARAVALLEHALGLKWSEAEGAHHVRLLLASRWAAKRPEEAATLLEKVWEGSEVHSSRVQAAFVQSRLAEAEGDLLQARKYLESAVEAVDKDDDPTVLERLQAELKRVSS